MVTDSSLTPSVALLVHPSRTVHSIVDCHEFTWSQKMMPVKVGLVNCNSNMCLDGARVWLSCQAIVQMSVLAGLLRVFANPVTYALPLAQLNFKVNDTLHAISI